MEISSQIYAPVALTLWKWLSTIQTGDWVDSEADLQVLENRQTNEVKHNPVPHRKDAASRIKDQPSSAVQCQNYNIQVLLNSYQYTCI
jgi:hypothetical protein